MVTVTLVDANNEITWTLIVTSQLINSLCSINREKIFVDIVLTSCDYSQASQISTDPADRNGIDRSILYITQVIVI